MMRGKNRSDNPYAPEQMRTAKTEWYRGWDNHVHSLFLVANAVRTLPPLLPTTTVCRQTKWEF